MSQLGQVLVVDDDLDVLATAEIVLRRDAACVTTLSSVGGLSAALSSRAFDVVLLDMNFLPSARSGRDGLDALTLIQSIDPTLSVVFMTAYGGVNLAVESMKLGARNLVLKPWRHADLVEALSTAAVETREKRKQRESLNLEEVERRTIESALTLFDGNISKAAAALGVTRPSLYRRMRKHGV